jgi:hypothetical protein
MQSRRISHKQDVSPRQTFQRFALTSPPTLLPSTWGHCVNDSGDMISLGFPNWT